MVNKTCFIEMTSNTTTYIQKINIVQALNFQVKLVNFRSKVRRDFKIFGRNNCKKN